MMSKKNVLLLGLFDTAIMTARCFKNTRINIYGMDYEEKHSGFSSRIIKSIKTPNPKDDEAMWLAFVLKWLEDSGQKFVLIPTSDEFVELAVQYYKQLSQFCSALLPSYKTINTIIERDKQFESAMACGLNVPHFINGSELIPDVLNDQLRYPLVIKPVNITEWKRGLNNKGFVILNEEELRQVLNQLKDKKMKCLVQNIIEGDNALNYEVNSLYLPDGRSFQHTIRKIRQYPDRYGTATCIESCSNQEVERLALEYIRKNNIFGFSNIEFKLNKSDNEYYYIETNARVWLQINYSMKLGLNFPMLYYKYLTGRTIEKTINLRRDGKWVDFLADILFWQKQHKEYGLSMIKFMQSWFPIISTGLFSITDPCPFFKDLKIKKRLKNVFRRKR